MYGGACWKGDRIMDIQTTASSVIQSKQIAVPETAAKKTASATTSRGNAEGTGKDPARASSDTIVFSAEGFRLSQAMKQETARPESSRVGASAKTAKDRADDELVAQKLVARLKEEIKRDAEDTAREKPEDVQNHKESTWKTARNAHFDRLQTLIRQGQYKVDPYMLDEIAVRMARLMN